MTPLAVELARLKGGVPDEVTVIAGGREAAASVENVTSTDCLPSSRTRHASDADTVRVQVAAGWIRVADSKYRVRVSDRSAKRSHECYHKYRSTKASPRIHRPAKYHTRMSGCEKHDGRVAAARSGYGGWSDYVDFALACGLQRVGRVDRRERYV